MMHNLPIVFLTGNSEEKVLGLLINLEMNACSSSGVISSCGLGTGAVRGVGSKGMKLAL